MKTILILTLLGWLVVLPGCAGKDATPKLVDLGDGTCQDRITGLIWQIDRSATAVNSPEEARAFITRLNQESKYQDWRLPTALELYDLNYLFDLQLNGNCLMSCAGNYWSEEQDGTARVGAWEIGAQHCDPQRQYSRGLGRGYVRPVRP